MESFFEFISQFIMQVIEGLFISNLVENRPYLNAFLKFILVTILMTIFLGIGAFIRGWSMEECVPKLIYPPLIGCVAAIGNLIFARKK